MKIQELRGKLETELRALLGEKRERIAELYFLLRQRKVKNVREISRTKRDVARILTLLKQ